MQMPTCLVARKLRIWVPASVIVAAPTAAEPLCKLTVEAGLHVLCREEGGREGAGDSQQGRVLGPCLVCCACMHVAPVTPHPLSAVKHPRCRQGVASGYKWCERPVIEAETVPSSICFDESTGRGMAVRGRRGEANPADKRSKDGTRNTTQSTTAPRPPPVHCLSVPHLLLRLPALQPAVQAAPK